MTDDIQLLATLTLMFVKACGGLPAGIESDSLVLAPNVDARPSWEIRAALTEFGYPQECGVHRRPGDGALVVTCSRPSEEMAERSAQIADRLGRSLRRASSRIYGDPRVLVIAGDARLTVSYETMVNWRAKVSPRNINLGVYTLAKSPFAGADVDGDVVVTFCTTLNYSVEDVPAP